MCAKRSILRKDHEISSSDSEDEQKKPPPPKRYIQTSLIGVSSSLPSATRDSLLYQRGYPDLKDEPQLNNNYLFYTNQLKSTPKPGGRIDYILEKWFGNYELLEVHHGYIQWLFPIRERGMNFKSSPLQPHEIQKIKSDPKCQERLLSAYKLMLDFFGMKLDDDNTGIVSRSKMWRSRFDNLRRRCHNRLRISRIIKSLGELGLERLQQPFVDFLIDESVGGSLPELKSACSRFYIHLSRDPEVRRHWAHRYEINCRKSLSFGGNS